MNWDAISWQLPAGILLLAFGGDLLVRGAATVAERLNMSRMLIGVTLVGFGTSMPELITSVRAALVGSPGIAIGNIVGSNISNVLLVLGTAALVYPIATPREVVQRNGLMVLAATAICVAVVYNGFLDRRVGVGLVALLLLYFLYSYVRDRRTGATRAGLPEAMHGRGSLFAALLLAIVGIGLVLLGARLLVDSAIDLARSYHISESIIGLTVVAIGTSLPELTTSVVAAFRKETAIALGNVLGSNIQNILGILGVTAIVRPIPVPAEIANLDIWVMAGATLALLLFASTNRRISRFEGLRLLLGYIAYVAYLARLAFNEA